MQRRARCAEKPSMQQRRISRMARKGGAMQDPRMLLAISRTKLEGIKSIRHTEVLKSLRNILLYASEHTCTSGRLMSWAKSTSQMEIPLQEILLRSVNCHAPCQFKYIVGGLIRHVEKVHCYRFMTGHVVSTDGGSLRPS